MFLRAYFKKALISQLFVLNKIVFNFTSFLWKPTIENQQLNNFFLDLYGYFSS